MSGADTTLRLNVSHEYFEANGIRLHCAVQGPESGASRGTIVFVHGFPEFWYCWKRQIPDFAQDYRVVAPDLRGYNLSDKPEGVDAYSIKNIAADLAGLIDALGDGPVVMVAHDWGGAIAWPFAAWYPEKLQQLVILNAPHPTTFARELMNNRAQQEASQYVNLLRSPKAETILSRDDFALMRQFAFGSMSDAAGLTDDDTAAYVEAWSQPGALTGSLNYYRAMPGAPPDLRDGASAATPPENVKVPEVHISVPTLVIWGEQDTALLPSLLDGLDAYVADLRIHRIPDASHWVQHEAADEVNRTIREFLG